MISEAPLSSHIVSYRLTLSKSSFRLALFTSVLGNLVLVRGLSTASGMMMHQPGDLLVMQEPSQQLHLEGLGEKSRAAGFTAAWLHGWEEVAAKWLPS